MVNVEVTIGRKTNSHYDHANIWDSLGNDGFINILKQLLEINAIGSYKKAMISGIFQRLYDEGESNDYFFYAHVLTLSKDELKSQSHSTSISCKQNENQFEQLSDGLLSHIATYLCAKNIFTKWNHVNRKFFKIGLNPGSGKKFEINFEHLQHVMKNAPKFKYDVTFSKLGSFSSFSSSSVMNKIVDRISMQHLRRLKINISVFMSDRDTSKLCVSDTETAACVERFTLRNHHYDRNGDVGKLFGFLTRCPIKRLNIRGFGPRRCSEKDLDNSLQILIPESPKAIELNKRLTTEITQKQRETLHSWQICKLETILKMKLN